MQGLGAQSREAFKTCPLATAATGRRQEGCGVHENPTPVWAEATEAVVCAHRWGWLRIFVGSVTMTRVEVPITSTARSGRARRT